MRKNEHPNDVEYLNSDGHTLEEQQRESHFTVASWDESKRNGIPLSLIERATEKIPPYSAWKWLGKVYGDHRDALSLIRTHIVWPHSFLAEK